MQISHLLIIKTTHREFSFMHCRRISALPVVETTFCVLISKTLRLRRGRKVYRGRDLPIWLKKNRASPPASPRNQKIAPRWLQRRQKHLPSHPHVSTNHNLACQDVTVRFYWICWQVGLMLCVAAAALPAPAAGAHTDSGRKQNSRLLLTALIENQIRNQWMALLFETVQNSTTRRSIANICTRIYIQQFWPLASYFYRYCRHPSGARKRCVRWCPQTFVCNHRHGPI